MRKMMIAALMIVAMLIIYEASIGGEAGIDRSVGRRAERINLELESIDP